MPKLICLSVCFFMLFSEGERADAAIVYDETTMAAFSTDNNNPTSVGLLMPGVNSVIGTVQGGQTDIDFWTFEIPAGFELSQWVVEDYVSSDSQGFLGINDAATFPFPILANGQNELAYLGGAAYGNVNVGNDILGNIGLITGRGFTGPLPSGTYTTLVQQLGPATTYTFGLNVTAVPEPSSFAAIGLSVGGVVYRRRKKFRRS